jgi:hypothetical protein
MFVEKIDKWLDMKFSGGPGSRVRAKAASTTIHGRLKTKGNQNHENSK